MSTPDRTHRRARERGLTFVELIMFIVIVSVGIAGILLVLNVTTQASADPQRRKQALAIAEALLEEVQGSRFTYCDPNDARAERATRPVVGATDTETVVDCATRIESVGPETASGDARPFDNVNDYVAALGTPQTVTTDILGQPLPAGYSATITITSEALHDIASDNTAANMNVLRIRVSVSDGRDAIVLDGYRTRYDPRWIP